MKELVKPISSVYRLCNIVLLFIFISGFAHGQATLSGQVSDVESGELLIGASIIFNGGGTVTDVNGKYSLEIPEGVNAIEVGYIGYETEYFDLKFEQGQLVTQDFKLRQRSTILETVTVTSGKFDKELGEVTVSMEVLSSKFIDQVTATSADDALARIPGVSVSDGQINVRGGSGWSYGAGSRVLLLIDDMPALQQDAGFPNWDDIPVENIAQIEVLKGAGSALYGSAAMNGIVNIRTAYPVDKPFTQFSSHVRLWGSPKDPDKKWWDKSRIETSVRLAHRQKFGKLDLTAGALYLTRNSFRQNTTDDYGRLNVRTSYHFTDQLEAGVNVNLNKGESASAFYWKFTDCSCGSFETDTSNLTVTNRFRYTIDPFVRYSDKKGNKHKFNGRFYGVDVNAINNQSNSSQTLYGEYQFQRQFEKANAVITAGLVEQFTFSNSQLYSDTTFTLNNTAIYAQLEKKFWDRLQVNIGGRYERNVISGPDSILVEGAQVAVGKRKESKPVMRFGLNYKLGKATFFRASWGQGYRYPTLAESYISTFAGALAIIPNPTLQSETGDTYELGVKQGFKLKKWNGFVDFSAFSSRYKDMMEFTLTKLTGSLLSPVPVFQSRNAGNTIINGIEFSLGAEGMIGPVELNLSGGVTLLDPTFQEFDLTGKDFGITLPDNATPAQLNAYSSSSQENVLKYRNKKAWNLNFNASFKWISLGMNYRYGSRMDAIDTGFLLLPVGIFNYRENHDFGFSVLDFRLDAKIPGGFSLGFHVENANNFEYSLRPGLLEAPRSFIFKLTWNTK